MARDASVIPGDQTFGTLFVTDTLAVTRVRQDAGAWSMTADDARTLTLHLGIDSDGDQDYNDATFTLKIMVRDPSLAQEALPGDVAKQAFDKNSTRGQ